MGELFDLPDKADIGKRIMSSRNSLEMTREELAEKAGVSVQFTADVEYGNKGMSLTTFYMMCQALNATPNYLLAGTKYSSEGSEEYIRTCDEITALLRGCDDKRISGAGEIVRIYVENTKPARTQDKEK